MNYRFVGPTRVTIATAGTAQQLSTNTELKVRSVVLEWDNTNDATDIIYVGASDVSSTRGVELTTTSRSIVIEVPAGARDTYIQVSTIWVDTNANGTLLKWAYTLIS